MSMNPDPEEENITGLEPGGGVPPGETPPAAAQMDADQGQTKAETAPKRSFAKVWLIVIIILVLLVILFFVGFATHMFNMAGAAAVGTAVPGLGNRSWQPLS
jgi:hypothetical protein